MAQIISRWTWLVVAATILLAFAGWWYSQPDQVAARAIKSALGKDRVKLDMVEYSKDSRGIQTLNLVVVPIRVTDAEDAMDNFAFIVERIMLAEGVRRAEQLKIVIRSEDSDQPYVTAVLGEKELRSLRLDYRRVLAVSESYEIEEDIWDELGRDPLLPRSRP